MGKIWKVYGKIRKRNKPDREVYNRVNDNKVNDRIEILHDLERKSQGKIGIMKLDREKCKFSISSFFSFF